MTTAPTRKISIGGLLIGAVFFFIGMVFIVGSWGAYRTDSNIEKNGASAEGRLMKKYFMRAADGDSDYMIEYWFKTADSVMIEATRGVNRDLWNELQEGQTLEIHYARDNPKRNFPRGAGVTSLGIVIYASVFGALFALSGGALMWRSLRPDVKDDTPDNSDWS